MGQGYRSTDTLLSGHPTATFSLLGMRDLHLSDDVEVESRQPYTRVEVPPELAPTTMAFTKAPNPLDEGSGTRSAGGMANIKGPLFGQ